jgi:hypothetical protein
MDLADDVCLDQICFFFFGAIGTVSKGLPFVALHIDSVIP